MNQQDNEVRENIKQAYYACYKKDALNLGMFLREVSTLITRHTLLAEKRARLDEVLELDSSSLGINGVAEEAFEDWRTDRIATLTAELEKMVPQK